jgi:hypothetical protein
MVAPITPEERESEHSKLRHDLELARLYGEARPDEWADLFVDNHPPVSVVMLFAGPNAAFHERALRELLSYPDQLEVRRTKYSRNQLREMLDEVRRAPRSPRAFHMAGISKGRANIWLAADQEQLAANLLAQYGEAVELKVGNFSFPMPELTSSPSGRRAARSQAEIPLISSEGLKVAISDDFVIESGRTGRGSLTFTNVGFRDVVLNTNGEITGRILDPATEEVVGGYVGMQHMPGIQFAIARDETASVPLLIGTASYRRELGFAIPPGKWMIEAIVTVKDIGERRTPHLPIVVIDRST